MTDPAKKRGPSALVTGSAGHLGEALMRALPQYGYRVRGLDILPSPFTDIVGSLTDRALVAAALQNVDVVLHTATLHKPHVATHTRQAFVDTNITGTLNLLEESIAAGIAAFVFTSTTSVYGGRMSTGDRATTEWIDEHVTPQPKNVYGVTKLAAEQFCELFHRKFRLPCIVLRTSRFFQDVDDNPVTRAAYADDNVKVNEFLYRRVDLADVVSAHVRAVAGAAERGFGRYIVSATTPFRREDTASLAIDAPAVVARYVPGYAEVYRQRGWSMFPTIDRVYANDAARHELGWQPTCDFARVLGAVADGQDYRSALAQAVGAKPYHPVAFEDGIYPVD